ncbi:MAG: hypothetical protein A2068_13265 [Ignavibacteria bacterium GWB2_35_6b]|nr:MAG: hypothetical protein A2068_13265 [Ignavibacteria bacterium GWB2_35_6b]
MKNKFLLFTAFVFLLCSITFAQQLPLDEIRDNYKSFNYQKVIDLSQTLLNDNSLTKEEIIELQTMNAVSYYSLNDETSARKSFIEILKLENSYSLDPAFISPKIITLFETTKKDFNQIYVGKVEDTKTENKTEENPGQSIQNYLPDNSYMFKSIVLPGWGHLSRGNNTKGFIIGTASLAALGTMIYYAVDAGDKEKQYLNETDPILIQQKYSSYNSSYKTRNTLIAAYAAIWLFAQLDLFVFDTGYDSSTLSISPVLNQQNNLSLSLQLQF